MEIGTLQRTPQLNGRNAKIVAVHCGSQILEACSATVELSHRHRRNQYNTRAGSNIEVQFIRDQYTVIGSFQCQIRFSFKEIKNIQLQLKGISFLAFKGVDLALNLGKLQRQHGGCVKAACGMYAIQLESIGFFAVHVLFLQSVAQLFQRKFCAVKDSPEPDITTEYKVSRSIGSSLFKLYLSVGNVHINKSIVLFGSDVKHKALLLKRDTQTVACTAFWLVKLEGRCAEMYPALLHSSIAMDNKLSVIWPCCRDRG